MISKETVNENLLDIGWKEKVGAKFIGFTRFDFSVGA